MVVVAAPRRAENVFLQLFALSPLPSFSLIKFLLTFKALCAAQPSF
jgi:hypothetical protein